MSNTVSINNSTINGCTGTQINHNYENNDHRTQSTINNYTTNIYEINIFLIDIEQFMWLVQKGCGIAVSLAGAGMVLAQKILSNTTR
jgi:hypothetical protein